MYIEKENELIEKIQTTNADNHNKWNADIDRLFSLKKAIRAVEEYVFDAAEGYVERDDTWKDISEAGRESMRKINEMCDEYKIGHMFKDVDIDGRELFQVCKDYQWECDRAYSEELADDE